MAIVTALQWVEETQLDKVILCSDSCSALMALENFASQSRQDIVNEVYETLYRLDRMNISIQFM